MMKHIKMNTKENGFEWVKELPYSVTVCDNDGNIIYMNDLAKVTFKKYGDSLIGRSLFEFHGEHASAKIRKMLSDGSSNSYTIEKAGVKKLIHQSPWYKGGKVSGLVEISIIIPLEMPHFVREA